MDSAPPPTTPFWFLPLAGTDHGRMAETVAYVVMIALGLHILICLRELRLPAIAPTAFLIYGAVLQSSWMVEHLHVIQISELIAFAYVVAWYELRRKHDLRAGMALGFACTLKLFPVRNASFTGIVLRLFSPTCVGSAAPSKGAIAVAVLGCLLMIFGAALLVMRDRRGSANIDLGYALFATLSVFVNPWIWEHYSVFLIFPIMVVAAYSIRGMYGTISCTDRSHWGQAVVGQLLLYAVGPIVAAASLYAMSFDMAAKLSALARYQSALDTPAIRSAHRALHFYEIANWAPWPLLCAMLAALLWARQTAT